jgi:solute carrier family 35, member C2
METSPERNGSSATGGRKDKITHGALGEDGGRSSSDTMEMDEIQSYEELDDDEETGLTEGQRKKRTRRKEENRQLDGRVSVAASVHSASAGSMGTTEEKLVSATLLKNIIINSLLIALWYSFSISISVYNKWMFSKENLDFHFPLFVTSIHMIVQFLLASSVLFFIPRFRPGADPNANPHDPSYHQIDGTETEETTKPPNKQPLMTKWFYLTRIGPCGTSTALDIGLGNFSLRFISLTFFTMCKSSVLAFVLLFAFLFHLESPTWRLCLIIFFMTVGVIMMVAGETAFDALGFILVMTASLCSGFRWSLTQILLLRNKATSNPFSTIFFLTPVMFIALFLLAIPIEGPVNVIDGVKELSSAKGGFYSFILLLFPGVLAFLMVSAEFALLQRSSVVTLSVCGIFKEVLTISAAGIVFGDDLSPVNVSGLIVTIASIAAYNYLKWTKMKKEAMQEAHEAIVERRNEESDVRQKLGVDGDTEGDGRRDSTSALMSDVPDIGANDDLNSSKANGVGASPG